jgi:protein gp37
MAGTSIEWTAADDGTAGWVWNPTTGCDKISPGCGLPRFEGDATGGCYALAMARRLKAMGQPKYQHDGDPRTSGPGFGLTVHPDVLTMPLAWRTPSRVFVNSMSDLGHARVGAGFLARVWATMAATPWHTYQILTKRPERLRRIVTAPGFPDMVQAALAALAQAQPVAVPAGNADSGGTTGWPLPNVWLGTSIELDRYTRRADELRATPAAIRMLSLEPLLGPLPSLDLTGMDWILIGGESGPRARPLDLAWARDLIARARAARVAVFVKQLGTCWDRSCGGGGRKGTEWDCWPDDLRLREFPTSSTASP